MLCTKIKNQNFTLNLKFINYSWFWASLKAALVTISSSKSSAKTSRTGALSSDKLALEIKIKKAININILKSIKLFENSIFEEAFIYDVTKAAKKIMYEYPKTTIFLNLFLLSIFAKTFAW